MKRFVSASVAFALLTAMVLAADDDRAKELDRVKSAGTVLSEIMGAPDKGIPSEILADADCVAVIPSMLKGGFVFGARYGKGVATCRHGNAWSAPAPIRIEGGSWGLQIGGEAVDLVMLVMNQKGMDQLLNSKFKIGADVSGAAGPVGRHAEGTTDWKLRAQVLTYSRARGAFAGLELNGAAIKQDTDDTRLLYGRMIPFNQILSGKIPAPSGTQPFLSQVARYYQLAKTDQSTKSASKTTGGTTGTTGDTAESRSSEQGTSGAVSSNATETNTEPVSSASPASSPSRVQTNIQKALSGTPGVNTSNVNVNVTPTTVELSGTVPSESDRQEVIKVAEDNADGRTVVDKNLKVQ